MCTVADAKTGRLLNWCAGLMQGLSSRLILAIRCLPLPPSSRLLHLHLSTTYLHRLRIYASPAPPPLSRVLFVHLRCCAFRHGWRSPPLLLTSASAPRRGPRPRLSPRPCRVVACRAVRSWRPYMPCGWLPRPSRREQVGVTGPRCQRLGERLCCVVGLTTGLLGICLVRDAR